MSNLIVAIDGPAASGKSSVARRVADMLGCVYVDSGALYRGLTWKAGARAGVEDVARLLESMDVKFFVERGAVRFTIDGVDPGRELRSEQVGKQVSAVAAMPITRTWALGLLRGLTGFGDLVMEGRDIGTAVFPGTPHKFFLNADASERARRRHSEIINRGEGADLQGIRRSIMERDALDSGRDLAPLRKAPGARLIDTTDLTIDEAASCIVNIVRRAPPDRGGTGTTRGVEKIPLLYRFCRFLLLMWMKVWLRYEPHGGEQVPEQGGCIVASNHASFLDPVIVGCGIMHRHLRFMARDTLFRNRLADWWATRVGVIRIDRTRGDVAALKAALAVLRSGGVVCLFPEGTRTADGRLQRARDGIGLLMARAGVPVVPAYIDGAFAVLPKGKRWARSRKVRVRYGSPILPSDLHRFGKGREAYRRMAALLMERISALGGPPGGVTQIC